MGTGNIACFFFAALASVIGVFCSWWTVYSSLYKVRALLSPQHHRALSNLLTHLSILTTRFPLPPPTQALQTQGGTFAYGKYFIHKGIFIGWCIWVIIAPPIGKQA